MASQLPNRPIIAKTGQRHKNSKRTARAAPARQFDDIPAAFPKQPRLHIASLTEVARGMPCCLEVPDVCNGNPETTVWCHSNTLDDGKGMSAKADDFAGALGCSDCHRWIDEPRNADAAEYIFRQGHRKTMRFLFGNGILVIDENAAKRVRHYG